MSLRRKAADSTGIASIEPVRCFCGGTEFDYSFARFPMEHVSRCKACGLEHRCELKVTPVKHPSPKPSDPPDPSIGFPPFWY